MPERERRSMARPIARRLDATPVRRMMARPVGEVGALASLPVGLILVGVAVVAVVIVVLLATRGGQGSGEVAGSRSSATPLPGVAAPIRFGTAIDPVSGEASEETTVFRPGDTFAYSVRLAEPIGTDAVEVEVIHRAADGSQETVQAPASQSVDPAQRVIAFQVAADALIEGFGTGDFLMRIYRGRELLAQGSFSLAGV
ncbi:MAG: hypothetical protein M3295_10275 [Chloroflexota bacterium]|nr:hypothetical protein [Chloroflexota bacterium]